MLVPVVPSLGLVSWCWCWSWSWTGLDWSAGKRCGMGPRAPHSSVGERDGWHPHRLSCFTSSSPTPPDYDIWISVILIASSTGNGPTATVATAILVR
ncbi:hypothetical protein BKA80DRAFT_266800 [Phyllosticta citrichinensis]